jgi:hypothetical protein
MGIVLPLVGVQASQISGHLFTPTGSYYSIQTATVDSGGATSVTFSSIPQTYTHLQVRAIGRDARSGSGGGYDQPFITFNGDTGNNYASHALEGGGSSASAYSGTSQANFWGAVNMPWNGYTSNVFGVGVMDILDYTNTNKYKTMRTLSGFDANGSGAVTVFSGLWQNTAAVTSITLSAQNVSWNFLQYTQFALYGIKA